MTSYIFDRIGQGLSKVNESARPRSTPSVTSSIFTFTWIESEIMSRYQCIVQCLLDIAYD